jgi:hypothetical protein
MYRDHFTRANQAIFHYAFDPAEVTNIIKELGDTMTPAFHLDTAEYTIFWKDDFVSSLTWHRKKGYFGNRANNTNMPLFNNIECIRSDFLEQYHIKVCGSACIVLRTQQFQNYSEQL